MQKIKAKDVLIYATMPRIIPRARKLLFSGFGYLSFLIASVYAMVRLLPADHPYLNPKNMGRFGVRHVIMEASRNLRFSKNNIDQIFIFFAILVGIVLLLVQFILLVYSLLNGQAHAFSWFDTADPGVDIAYTLLDRVFGVPGIFCSSFTAVCTDYSADANGPLVAGAPVIPLPFHTALHGLFRFYSTGLLLIAVLIFLYFVVVVLLETAVSGTPFGRRFQNVWVPIRLVVALGLLVPIGFGLNSGQYITLYAAKYGSSFATNGWEEFNTAVATHPLFGGTSPTDARPIGERYTSLAIPEAPDSSPVVEAMTTVHACAYAYAYMYDGLPNPMDPDSNPGMFNRISITGDYADPAQDYFIRPFFVKNPTNNMIPLDGAPIPGLPGVIGNAASSLPVDNATTYLDGVGFYYGGDIVIRFGLYKLDNTMGPAFQNEIGYVKPLCGDIRIPVSDLKDIGGAQAAPPRGGADFMLRSYFLMVMGMWQDDHFKRFARSYVTLNQDKSQANLARICTPALSGCGTTGYRACGPSPLALAPQNRNSCYEAYPTQDWKVARVNVYNDYIATSVRLAWSQYIASTVIQTRDGMTADIMERGWGGAGIWYNRLAEINGAFINGVMSLPVLDKYPLVMEQIRDARMKENNEISRGKMFEPTIKQKKDGTLLRIAEEGQEKIGQPMDAVYKYFRETEGDPENLDRTKVQNLFVNAFHLLMGTSGLAKIRTTNAHLHPLAQLVAVGKGLVESAVRNMAASSVTAFMGGMISAIDQKSVSGGLLEAASQIFLATAFMGLTAGFVLYYVLPFLPFVYFYFAVASWVKAIFEAMVGVPLWALAHLRIDGEGLPGDAAQNGYFLILEIFIRPILTVVGLVAAISIFSMQVRVLNFMWDLVTTNISGFVNSGTDIAVTPDVDSGIFQRGPVDQFFFTIIYTIICYMLATAAFKLIDKIPDNILRWAGAGVSSFGDIDQDHVEGLNRYAATGGMVIGGQAAGAIRDTASGVGQGLGKLIK